MTREEFARLLDDFTRSARVRRRRALRRPFHRGRRLLRLHLRSAPGPRRYRAHDAGPVSPRCHRLSLGDVRSRVRRPPGLCVVAVELHLDHSAVQGPARRDRRHEPLHPARRPDRRVPRVRQRRRRHVAARRRAGADGEGVPALDRMARGAPGDTGLSGAAEGLARKNVNEKKRQGDRGDLSAYSLRGRATRSRPSRSTGPIA